LLLLVLSCGTIISAYRSLSRDFSGFMVRKTSSSGAVSNQYWLFILPDSQINTDYGSAAVLNALTPDLEAEIEPQLQRVGVSAIVFNDAKPLCRIEKGELSPFIKVDSQSFIDLGINWLLFGLAGILLSIWMYVQTLKKVEGNSRYESEDIELPGL